MSVYRQRIDIGVILDDIIAFAIVNDYQLISIEDG
jgi:hypothetical protein